MMEALIELRGIIAASSAMIRHRMEALVELDGVIAASSAMIYRFVIRWRPWLNYRRLLLHQVP